MFEFAPRSTAASRSGAKAKGWTVVSMKDDWKKILAFE